MKIGLLLFLVFPPSAHVSHNFSRAHSAYISRRFISRRNSYKMRCVAWRSGNHRQSETSWPPLPANHWTTLLWFYSFLTMNVDILTGSLSMPRRKFFAPLFMNLLSPSSFSNLEISENFWAKPSNLLHWTLWPNLWHFWKVGSCQESAMILVPSLAPCITGCREKHYQSNYSDQSQQEQRVRWTNQNFDFKLPIGWKTGARSFRQPQSVAIVVT